VRFRAYQGRAAQLLVPASVPAKAPPTVAPPPPVAPAPKADARLPRPGTVLRKAHKGTTHEVTVKEDGFDYQGTHFTSLSTVAKAIAGTAWNGFAFFGLTAKPAVSRAAKKGNRS
jgi:Protein of unknown function (DUF2924)